MKSFLFPLAVLVSSAMAQDQTQTTSACGADYIVESCLDTQKAALGVCTVTDYACHCNGWTNLMACYINCPNDPRQRDSAGQRDIYCQYVTTSSTTTVATRTSSAAPKKTNDDDVEFNQNDSAGTDEEGFSTTDTADRPASTNSAADLVLSAGRVLAAVAGAVAVVL